MRISRQHSCLRSTVESTLLSFSQVGFRNFGFSPNLEELFEESTREARCRRMWFDGLIAIAAFNLCLLLDFLTVKDRSGTSVLLHTSLITPIALLVNQIVRRNPRRLVREGCVAYGMLVICLINLVVEGHDTTASTLFGAICMLITALFVGVVMRLRLPFALPTLAAMLLCGFGSLGVSPSLKFSETMLGASMIAIGIAIILVANLSLEASERKSFLLGLQRDLQATELEWANLALKELSSIDELTRLPNRRALDERVALQWDRCTAERDFLSVVVVDVDFFKSVNDRFGHLFGDETLRHIGALLPRALRSADHMAARFGGEEFVLLLPCTGPDAALVVAERVRSLVEATAPPSGVDLKDGPPLRLTISCGVSTYRTGGRLQWNDIMAAADKALYRAKCNGRNRVEFHLCEEPVEAPKRHTESRFRRASGQIRARLASGAWSPEAELL